MSIEIDYVSDLHLSYYFKIDGGYDKFQKKVINYVDNIIPENNSEWIIVAGDIGEYNTYIVEFLDALRAYYKHIFFVFGNHDLYLPSNRQQGIYKNSDNRKQEVINYFDESPNIHILDRDVIEVDGITVAGFQNWYSVKDPDTFLWWMSNSNDSQYIFPHPYSHPDRWYHNEQRYMSDMEWYSEIDNVDILISHIPPIHYPNSKYNSNLVYYNPVKELKSKYWIAGHQHALCDVNVGDTQILANPWGFPGETDQTIKSFELIKKDKK